MKFDFAIGNPPYMVQAPGTSTSDIPCYNDFMDAAFEIADKVELITPARFLFDAGATPKTWNKKMLDDEHFKVLEYESDATRVFNNTLITGGVAITYRDVDACFGSIGFYSPFVELNSIRNKCQSRSRQSLNSIISNRGQYRFSELCYIEQPEAMKLTSDPRIGASSFKRMPSLFTDSEPNDGYDYIQVLGNESNRRVLKWFRKDYLKPIRNLDKYKVFISKADGAAGQIGNPVPARIAGKPVVAGPKVASTETFISIGSCDSEHEAKAICSYVQTKFARVLLGVLKITQDCTAEKWAFVPLQDFSPSSDIDWSKPVPEIDQQLYTKYGLSHEEIEFIETHVKEMN